MLRSLHVKNFAIIDETEVEFRDHLNIMTGETGAGKSILIGSVNAALGAKVTKDSIRQGAEYALVELTFDGLPANVCEALREREIVPEDGMVILSRKIMESGKSVCRINGESVTAALLKEAAGILIDIHGQQENQSLLQKSAHLRLLDRYASEELADLPEKLSKEYREYRRLADELSAGEIGEEERNREAAYLKFAVDEIREARLLEGEDETLEEEYRMLSNARQIEEALGVCLQCTREGEQEGAEGLISMAGRQMAKVADLDKRLSDLMDTLSSLEDLLAEFNRGAEEFAETLAESEERFCEVEDRLNRINRLKSKYGRSISEILRYAEEGEEKLQKYLHYDEYINRLRKDYEQKRQACLALCEEISKIRKTRAADLAREMKEALLDLNFAEVRFELAFERTAEFHASGFDACEFLISLNPGEPLKPLVKVASGGELSRVMLALKSVLADKDEIPTLIFDEIDSGISGRTAQKVSEKLAQISAGHQILCITHLAQIASMADTHFVIEKETLGSRVKTQIRELTEEESLGELARLLGGAKLTSAVYENAKEMKQLAGSYKEYRKGAL